MCIIISCEFHVTNKNQIINNEMKVLFVCRGNKKFEISPIIRAQADSLAAEGIAMNIFPLNGKGVFSYFNNAFLLRREIKKNKYDIVHAHFGLSGIIAAFVCSKNKLIVSLMGSEAYYSKSLKFINSLFANYAWGVTIVKTQAMKAHFEKSKPFVVPNGVNLDVFFPMDKQQARALLGLPENKRIILFPSYPFRKEKNYDFAKAVSQALRDVELIHFDGVKPEMVNLMLNAANVIILPSFFEGSPNVIKEAMACNRPIVANKVGDVVETIGTTDGCYITHLTLEVFIEKTRLALDFSEKTEGTKGRERIINQKLDAQSVAQKLIGIYTTFLKNAALTN